MFSISRLIVRPVRIIVRYFVRAKKTSPFSFKVVPGFDAEYYLRANPDVRSTGQDPLRHYAEHGWRDGRRPSAGFDAEAYLEANPDVKAADVNPLIHYLHHGIAEGRHLSVAAAESAEAGRRHRPRAADQGPVQQMVVDLIVARLARDGIPLALPAPDPLPPDDDDPHRLASLIRTLAALDLPDSRSPSRISAQP